MENSVWRERLISIRIFKKIIEKGGGKGISEAIIAVQKGIMDRDVAVRDSAMDLLDKLFEIDRGFSEIAKTALEVMENRDFGVRLFSIRIFKKIIEKGGGKGVPEAITAMDLFYKLIETDQGISETIKSALKGMKNRDLEVRLFYKNF